MRSFGLFLICITFLLPACSANKASFANQDNMYEQQEIGKFVRDTTPEQRSNQYIIGVGDVMDVVFFFHQELTTRDLHVRSDGRITLPYVGDIMAAGHTPMALDSVLTVAFSEILREPNISVIMRSSADKRVYVLGQVRRAGSFKVQNQMSLLQAVAAAGGLEEGAKADHTLIIRRQGTSRIVGIEVNLKAILKGEAIQNDVLLRDFDIVYVPKTRIQSVAEFTRVVNDIITAPTSLVLKGWQIKVTEEQLELLRDDIEN